MSINEMWEHLVRCGDLASIGEHTREFLAVGCLTLMENPIKEKVIDLTQTFCCSDSVHLEEEYID